MSFFEPIQCQSYLIKQNHSFTFKNKLFYIFPSFWRLRNNHFTFFVLFFHSLWTIATYLTEIIKVEQKFSRLSLLKIHELLSSCYFFCPFCHFFLHFQVWSWQLNFFFNFWTWGLTKTNLTFTSVFGHIYKGYLEYTER